MNKKILSLSFCISLMIWFYVMNSQTHLVTKSIPIKFKLPSSKSISEFNTDKISVKIKGTRMFLQQLEDKALNLELDASGFKKNKIIFSVLSESISLPFGTEIVEIWPKTIELKLGKTRKRKKLLTPSFSGELKDGLVLKSFKLKPNSITVSGTLDSLRGLEGIPTTTIYLDKIDEFGAQKIYPKKLDQRFSYEINKALELDYELGYRKNSFKFKDVPISLKDKVQLLQGDQTITLDVFAPEELGKNLKNLDFKAKLVLPGNKIGPVKAKVEVELPKDVELLRIYPEYIRVFVPRS